MTIHIKQTKQEFEQIINSSNSVAECLRKMGLVDAGGNYRIFHRYVEKYEIDTSHFSGMLWSKGKTIGPKRPIEDYLSNTFPINSHRLRLRLIKEGIFNHECSVCKLTQWLNKPVSLELDHIDGNHDNNHLDNLRLLCPNCHAQTSNYRGKNKGLAYNNKT